MRENLLEYLYESADCENDVGISYKRRLRRSDWSYARLARTAFQIAREFEARKICKGDHVIIQSENCPEWVAAFYGALLCGAILVPLDELSSADFVEKVCEKIGPKLMLLGAKTAAPRSSVKVERLEFFSRTAARHSSEHYAAASISRDHPAVIVYTSGTTSSPKGVQLTHGNILANIEAIEDAAQKYLKWRFLVHPVRILCLLPLSHVFGQFMGIFIPPLLRAQVVMHNRNSPGEVIRKIKSEGVSVVATVPRMLETLQSAVESMFESPSELNDFRRRLSYSGRFGPLRKWWEFRRVHRTFGWKFWGFISGGAALSNKTEQFWRDIGFVVIQGYGMTETSALISLNDPFRSGRGSIGKILKGQEIRIDETGEILVRGKNVAGSIEERNDVTPDEAGWLRTGDLGYVDDTGRLYFRGRKKDVIVTAAGLNVFPKDVEAALAEQPEIIASVVTGLTMPTGDVPAATLITRPGVNVDAAVQRANSLLAPHQRIQRWMIWPEPDFPRTATLKVRTADVADALKRELNHGRPPAATAGSALSAILARIEGGNADTFGKEKRLIEDLNLDSLARVELLSAVEEHLHVDLDEQQFTTAETVGDLERLIRSEGPSRTEPAPFHYPYWVLRTPWRWLRTVFYSLVLIPASRILCRSKISGLEHLAAVQPPVLFASNHVTELDAGLILTALPHRFRSRMAVAIDGERLMTYRHPPPGTGILTRVRFYLQYFLLFLIFNVFPLPRKSGFRRSFEYAGDAMDAGFNVLIFPEGRITPDGRLQELQRGVGVLAAGLETNIVPVKITGLYEAKSRGARFYTPPGSVKITFGKPIMNDANSDSQGIVERLEEELRNIPA